LQTDINSDMKSFTQLNKDLTESFLIEGNIDVTDIYKRNNVDTIIKRSVEGELIYSSKDTASYKLPPVKDSSEWIQTIKKYEDTGVAKGSAEGKEIQVAFKNTYGKSFSVGNVDKIMNGLSTLSGKNPSGEDWESLIAVGVKVHNKLPIDGPEWDRAQKYWEGHEKQAVRLGKDFVEKLGVNDLKQLGASVLPITGDWSKWGATNRTPKTDLIDGNKHISLKKSGGSQLMSAGKEEAIATVNAAMSTYSASTTGSKKIKEITSLLEEKMVKLSTKQTVDAVQSLQKKGKLSDSEAALIKELDDANLGANEINSQLNKLFSDDVFKSHFCFEAATGRVKFGTSSQGVANSIVTFRDTGAITDILQLDSAEGAGKVLARGNSFYVSFKSSSGSAPYLALRSKKLSKKALAEETFHDIIQEEMLQDNLLMEEMQQLDEFAMFSKLSKMARNIGSELANTAKKVLDKIMSRVRSAFSYIVSLGKRAASALLRFFGVRIDNVRVKGGGKYPLR